MTSKYSEPISRRQDIEHAGRLESIGRLSAGVAHEMNTPMQYIGDNLRYLEKCVEQLFTTLEQLPVLVDVLRSHEIELPEPARSIFSDFDSGKYANTIRSFPEAIDDSLAGVRSVATIVQAMKQFAHPGANRRMGTNINEVVLTAITLAKNEYKRIADVEFIPAAEIKQIEGIGAQLSQAVLNLVINSAQAIAAHMAETDTRGKIKIETKNTSSGIELSLTDNGGGICPEALEHIFEPFFTTKEPGVGTGQGLAFVHSTIVDTHGGSLHVENDFGTGATFVLRLPCKSPRSVCDTVAMPERNRVNGSKIVKT